MLSFIKKISISSALLSAILFSACSETSPIEAQNEYGEGGSIEKKFISNLETEMTKVDYYSCVEQYNKDRCNNFKDVFGSYDAPEIANPYYNDKAEYTYKPASSSSKTEESNSSSSEEFSSSSEEISSSSSAKANYLTENKTLSINLTSYALKDSTLLPKGDSLSIRFKVKLLSDGVQAASTIPTLFFKTSHDEIEWSGTQSISVDITKGIDELILCPEVTITMEVENISSGQCLDIKDIGFVKEKDVSKETDVFSDNYSLSWEWMLY